MLYSSIVMIKLLHSTLLHYEAAEDLDPNDPTVVEFKASIRRSIA